MAQNKWKCICESLRTNESKKCLTIYCITSKNGQTYFKNLAANAARF